MIVRPVVYLCVLILFSLYSLFGQQAPAAPQVSPPKNPSSSTLIVGFGPTVSNAEGKQAAEKLLHAMGGAAKVNSLKTLHQTVAAVQDGRHIEIEQSIVYPDKQAQTMRMPQGKSAARSNSERRFHGRWRAGARASARSESISGCGFEA